MTKSDNAGNRHDHDTQPEHAARTLQEEAAGQQDGRDPEHAPGAAREGKEDAGGDDQQRHRQQRHARDGPCQQQIQQIDTGQHQERPEHVRVLEGAGGAIVFGEDFRPGEGMKIARDAEQGGQHRRHHIGQEDQPVEAGLHRSHSGEEHGGEGEKQRDGEIERRVGQIRHLRHRDHATDVHRHQKHQQRYRRARDAQAEQRPHHDEPGHVKVIRRRLVDDEAGKKNAKEHRARRNQRDQLGVDRGRRQLMGDRAQYAFSVLSSRTGVRNRIRKSNSSDQFSM